MLTTYKDWLASRQANHAHCIHDCEHPQPFMQDGKCYCGRCYHESKELNEVIPCIPEVCKEH